MSYPSRLGLELEHDRCKKAIGKKAAGSIPEMTRSMWLKLKVNHEKMKNNTKSAPKKLNVVPLPPLIKPKAAPDNANGDTKQKAKQGPAMLKSKTQHPKIKSFGSFLRTNSKHENSIIPILPRIPPPLAAKSTSEPQK